MKQSFYITYNSIGRKLYRVMAVVNRRDSNVSEVFEVAKSEKKGTAKLLMLKEKIFHDYTF